MIQSLSKPQLHIAIFIAACFGASIYATQVIPNPVNPQIGENLWQMNYRQSIAIDDIMDTTTLCCNCDYFITQADIDGNGGGFTITQPGNWCLGENIITSQPITVANLPGVVFDLKGRTISSSVKGSSNLPTGIIDVTNSPNTIIKNGYLIGLDLTPLVDRRSGVRFFQSDGSVVQNVQAQFFGSVDDPNVFEGNFAFFAHFSNYVQFLDCFATGPFLEGFTIFGSNGIVKNCEVSHFSGYIVNPGPLTINGVGFWLQGSNNYATHCVSSGGSAQPTSSSSGSIGFFLQGNNNAVNECTALNHKLNAYPSLGADSGSGFSVIGDNCQISNCTSAYNEGFGIINTGIGLVVCNNLVHDNGTNLSGTTESSICALINAASGCDFIITQADIGNGGIYTITQPGKYCLAESVTYANSNAITINSNNVVLELNGHPMTRTTNNGSPNTTGAIVCNGAFCIIENGDISSDTIVLTNTGTTIKNCKINGNFTNNSGIVIKQGADACQVLQCEISNSGQEGILVFANNTFIQDCNIQNTRSGIVITGNQTNILNCTCNHNRSFGFESLAPATGLYLVNCTANFNGYAGIQTDGSINGSSFVNVQINNCNTNFNANYGIFVGATYPIAANWIAIGLYKIVNDYETRVTNCTSQGNGVGNLIMFIRITDPLNVQPTITSNRLISPTVGSVVDSFAQFIWDTTLGSSLAGSQVPQLPGFGANRSL